MTDFTITPQYKNGKLIGFLLSRLGYDEFFLPVEGVTTLLKMMRELGQ